MTKRRKIFFVYLIISLTPILNSYSQTLSNNTDFLLQNFILSLNGGVSYGYSDYENSSIGPAFRGSLEYYPIIIQNARLGVKVFASGLTLNFSDSRNTISTDDGQREIPEEILTDAIQIGTGLSFGYAFGNYVIPSITLGGSFLRFSPKDSDGKIRPFNKADVYQKDIVLFFIEGEIKVKVSKKISINAVLSYYPTSTDYIEDVSAATSNDTYFTGMLGLSYALSGNYDSDGDGIADSYDQCPETPKGVIVDEFGCPIDSDLDGVPDYLDKCSSTPAGISVDSTGCPLDSDKDGVPDYLDRCSDTPANLEVDSFGCPPDADSDGIPDYFDKCSDTPIGIAVDSLGCPIDADKDGIPDYLDKCLNTPLNAKVDSSGCPEETVETFYQFILRGDDTFKSNSAELIETSKILLKEIANYIKNQPESKWRIEGYMDNQGSISLLKKLSFDRAKSVLDYLVSQGLSNDQFSLFGLGNSSPIANNNTTEGRSTNRRIIIIRED
jgi:outer membrane protein OmpA-like peptidoglycan-associated protein